MDDGFHLAEAPVPGQVSLGLPVLPPCGPGSCDRAPLAAVAHITCPPAPSPLRFHLPRHIPYLLWLARPLADLTELVR